MPSRACPRPTPGQRLLLCRRQREHPIPAARTDCGSGAGDARGQLGPAAQSGGRCGIRLRVGWDGGGAGPVARQQPLPRPAATHDCRTEELVLAFKPRPSIVCRARSWAGSAAVAGAAVCC